MAGKPLAPEKVEQFRQDLRQTLRHGHTITVVVIKTSSSKSFRAQLLISVVAAHASEGTAIEEITYKAGHVLPYDFDNAAIKVPVGAEGVAQAADELVAKLAEVVFGDRALLHAKIV